MARGFEEGSLTCLDDPWRSESFRRSSWSWLRAAAGRPNPLRPRKRSRSPLPPRASRPPRAKPPRLSWRTHSPSSAPPRKSGAVMVERFEEEFGVDTNYVRLSSGEALARLQAGAEAPEFSVWWGGPADGFVAANADGLIEPYQSANAEAIPDDQKDPDGVWTGVYVGALGFCSNTALLEELGVEIPDSWDDLADPALEGQVAIA